MATINPRDASFTRRRFLAGTGLTLAGAALSYRSVAAPAPSTPTSDDLSDWSNVRAQFGVSPNYIQLSAFFLASHPRSVRESIEHYRRMLDEDPFHTVEEEEFGKPLRVESVLARYLGGKPNEVALTDSTTMGLALVYHGLPLKRGDEILTTAHDHYSHHESIRLAAARGSASVRKIRLFENSASISVDEITSRLRKGITPATKVVGVTWVHSSSGVRLPIREIARAVGETNRGRGEDDQILLVVDGVHGFGVADETVAEMGADFFAAGTHKWMFGPRGTGLIWARAEMWRRVRPTIPSFADGPVAAWMAEREAGPTEPAWVTPGGFHSFEHRWAVPAAVEFHEKLGRKRVAARIHSLNTLAKEELGKMKKVTLHTPHDPALSAGLICFDVEGMKPGEVVGKLLEQKIIASETPYRVSYARIAPSLLNDEEQIEKTLAAIRSLT